MKLLVYARHDLIDRPLPAEDPVLLLEGSWAAAQPSARQWSLDDAVDGRFAWIDRQAADFAELPVAVDRPPDGADSPARSVSPAYLNALGLRYYLVKLLRAAAYFTEVQPLRPGDRVELVAAVLRDEDYADVLRQLCRASGAGFRVRWVRGRPDRPRGSPSNGLWRRWAARLGRLLQTPRDRSISRRNVVLCGNPRLLDPVCRELLARRCNLWWLYDRFAVRSWFRWQAAGVQQLVCDSSLGREDRLGKRRPGPQVPERLDFRGVNLAGPVRRWLAARAAAEGPRQTRLVEQIDAHFRRLRPAALALDEDATPMARAAVAVSRHYAAVSVVVQHGVPCCRFGFAPLLADCILVWGRSSQRRLIDWGVPPERIRVTGCPQWDDLDRRLRSSSRHRRKPRRRRILLLATVPPRDDRPDAVALHLTGRSYAEMVRAAFAAAAGVDGVELVVKLHPRAPDDPVVRTLRADFPALRSRVVHHGPLETRLAGVDCVLSCGSSAGVEATLAGLPVIQLVPPGASNPLSHDQWAMAGTAHNGHELAELLSRALGERRPPRTIPDPQVFGNSGRTAAARIADEVLALIDARQHHTHFELGTKPQQPEPV